MHLHSFHLRQMHLRRPGELGQVFASSALRSFAFALVSIFIPIYLLQLGYSLTAVLLFLAAANVAHALFVVPAAWVAARFGIKHCMLWSVVFEAAYFLLLARLGPPDGFVLLAGLVIISGIYRGLYFTGLHMDLSKFTKPGKRGSEVGGLKFLTGIFHAAGPFMGGLLLASVGFHFVFVAAAVMVAISGLPLLLSPDTRAASHIKLRNIFRGRKAGDYLGFAGYGVESGATGNIWVIFLFLSVLGSYTFLGSVASVALAVSLFADLATGFMADRHKHRVLRAGSALDTLVGLGRVFAATSFHAFAINTASGVSKKMLYIPMDIISYDRANRGAMEEYIVFREIAINAFRAVFYVLVMLIASLPAGLFIGALGSLLFLFF